MNRSSIGGDATVRLARLNVRRVAIGATGFALAIYVLACAVADLAVVRHFNSVTDARLSARLADAIQVLPKKGPTGPVGSYRPDNSGDLDDAPIVLWWTPRGSHRSIALDTNAPALPAGAAAISRPTNLTIGSRDLRVVAVTVSGGRLTAGTSAAETHSALSTLLIIEGALAPIVLASLYLSAWVIGRRATAPIEQARQRQLEFTADASHELRTPLSVIEAEVGLALNSQRSASSYRTSLFRVSEESKRLRNIVEDLLWLARVDALPKVPTDDEVDLDSLVEVCAQRFFALAAQREIEISVHTSGSRAVVVAPPEWLDRLISVLFDNACRYSNEGGHIDATVTAVGDRVRVTVDDSGSGIRHEARTQIFERFHRASTVPGGAGLGLAIADAVVKATEGVWEITDSPAGGARIGVSWPRVRSSSVDTTMLAAPDRGAFNS